jgi:hypothetical protein
MTKNPFINALLGLGYISVISVLLFYGSELAPKEDNVLMPISMLSLFVLSASIMAYLFLYEPIVQFLSGERERGVMLFLQTVGIFACFTFALFLLVFFVFASVK